MFALDHCNVGLWDVASERRQTGLDRGDFAEDSERRWTGMLQDGGFRTSISGRKEHAWMLKVEMWIGAMGVLFQHCSW